MHLVVFLHYNGALLITLLQLHTQRVLHNVNLKVNVATLKSKINSCYDIYFHFKDGCYK